MLTPRFWRNNSSNPGMMTFFLTPFSWIWTLGLKHRLNVPSYKVKVPVICIGNINLGGVGKTPAVIAFTEKLKEIGVDGVLTLRSLLENLLKQTEPGNLYPGKPIFQILKLLKVYELAKEPQLEMFQT